MGASNDSTDCPQYSSTSIPTTIGSATTQAQVHIRTSPAAAVPTLPPRSSATSVATMTDQRGGIGPPFSIWTTRNLFLLPLFLLPVSLPFQLLPSPSFSFQVSLRNGILPPTSETAQSERCDHGDNGTTTTTPIPDTSPSLLSLPLPGNPCVLHDDLEISALTQEEPIRAKPTLKLSAELLTPRLIPVGPRESATVARPSLRPQQRENQKNTTPPPITQPSAESTRSVTPSPATPEQPMPGSTSRTPTLRPTRHLNTTRKLKDWSLCVRKKNCYNW